MSSENRPVGFVHNIASFAVGLAVIIAIQALSSAAGLVSAIAQWFVAIIAAVVAAFVVVDRFGKIQILALILAAAASIFWSIMGFSTFLQLFAPGVYGISVAQAPRHPEAGMFVFVDGKVRVDLVGEASESAVFVDEKSWHRRETESRYRAAPLVHKGWVPGDPVPVWVACSDSIGDYGFLAERISGCMKTWKENHRAGYVVRDNLSAAGYDAAIAHAVKLHGLKRDNRAPVIVWSADPRSDLFDLVRPGFIVIVCLHAIWFIAFPIALVLRRFILKVK